MYKEKLVSKGPVSDAEEHKQDEGIGRLGLGPAQTLQNAHSYSLVLVSTLRPKSEAGWRASHFGLSHMMRLKIVFESRRSFLCGPVIELSLQSQDQEVLCSP